MSLSSGGFVGIIAVGAAALLAGCAEPGPKMPEVAFNPPGTALAALPPASVTWYQVAFETNGTRIDADGRQVISNIADSMRASPGLTATVIGKADPVGGDTVNMRLSRQRAMVVRDALLLAGKLPAARVETRWTGERLAGEAAPSNVADSGGRVVDIGVH